MTVHFSGRRVGVTGRPRAGDRFTQIERVDSIVPGSGPVSVTTVVKDVNPGEWNFTARTVGRAGRRHGTSLESAEGKPSRRRIAWPWLSRRLYAEQPTTARTTLLPFALAPGVIPLAYTVLVAVGMLAGLSLQAVVLSRAGLAVVAAIAVSLAAIVAGVLGAKLWYIAGNRGRRLNGWCIQGFIFGASLAAIPLATANLQMPLGRYLDSMAPGLLIGMASGRLGCFFAGC